MNRCLFFSFIISVLSAFECPSSNWSRFRNKCYLKDTSKYYSFQANVDLCESLNATTVSIHSEEENNFINTTLSDTFYWLGIRQVDFGAKTYAWLDGSDYNYSNWDERLGRKSCAGAYFVNGYWRDITNCEDINRGFCQIDFDSPFYTMQSQINQLRQDFKDDRKTDEIRFNETNARLDKALNTTFAWITNLNSTFEAKFNDKDIQVENIKKEMAQHRLMDNKLEQALNTQKELNANLTSDFRKKEMEIKSTNQELVRLSLIITRLENAIYTQNDLIHRISSASEIKSTKN